MPILWKMPEAQRGVDSKAIPVTGGLFWRAVGGSISHPFSLSSCPSKSRVEATLFSLHPEQPLGGWPQCSATSTQTQSGSRRTHCAEKVNSCLLRTRGLIKALASSWQLSALDDYLHDFICSQTLYREHYHQTHTLPNVQGDAR